MPRSTLYQVLFTVLLIPTLCRPGFAHKVRIFAWQDGDNIVTESKFSGGRAAQNATISVVETKTGQILLSGTTDTEGLFSFAVPMVDTDELQIIVEGGDGHKNSWNYTLEKASGESKSNVTQVSKEPEQLPLPPVSKELNETVLPPITASELTRIIDTELDKKLAPIKRSLAENSEKGPTLQDILGGIGYILGLAGIAAYMQSRKKDQGGRS